MMRRVRKVALTFGDDAGFSIAEVMVAFIILAIALIPMVNMFDAAFDVSMAATDMNMAQECLRLYTEKVKNIPFYFAHSEEDASVKKDVDDFFWGSRLPVNDNSFSDAPYVLMKASTAEPYVGMKVEIRMAYLDEDFVEGRTLLEAADLTILDANWGPMKLYGYDRPLSDTGKALNLILYEVRVTLDSGKAYSSTNLYSSPTDVLANVYIDKVVNVDTDESKKGTRYNNYGDCVSAPHTKSNIMLRFYGEGFTAADLAAGLVTIRLVRVDDNDITPSGVVYGEDAEGKYLEGSVSLDSGGASLAHNPWSPRRAVGEWDAFLVVNHVISVRDKAFTVEYPLPIFGAASNYNDLDGDRKGLESETDEILAFSDVGYFTHVKPAVGQNPGIGAVIQLIHTETNPQTGLPADVITGTEFELAIYTDPRGYQSSGLSARSHFNLIGHAGGWYRVRIVNCIQRVTSSSTDALGIVNIPGNTYIDLPESFNYYLEGPPAIYDFYVTSYVELGGGETPLPISGKRNFMYDDRTYMYKVRIEGVNIDEYASVKLGIGAFPVGDNTISPQQLVYLNQYTLEAIFNIGENVGDDQRGWYWLYVENSNGFGSLTNPAFDIRRPAPIIYDYSVDTYGLWQNYYDVQVTLAGECFDLDLSTPGPDFELRMRRNTDPPPGDFLVATEAMYASGDGPVSLDGGRQVVAKLNFVDCDQGSWELYGVNAGSETDTRYQDALRGVTYLADLDISLGAPVLRTAVVPSSPEDYSLIVRSRYQPYSDSSWQEWSDWYQSTEGTLENVPPFGNIRNAWAWENDPSHDNPEYRTRGEMYFVEIRGMGFNKGGTLSVHVKNDNAPPHVGMDKLWAGLVVHADRSQAKVWVEMDESMKSSSGPDEGGKAEIRLKNDSAVVWQDWYMDRIALRQEG